MKNKIEYAGGFIYIRGSNRPIKADYAKPEWSEEPTEYIRYNNMRHYLSEFMPAAQLFSDCKKYVRGDIIGYMNYTYSSGLLLTYDFVSKEYYVYYWYTSSLG